MVYADMDQVHGGYGVPALSQHVHILVLGSGDDSNSLLHPRINSRWSVFFQIMPSAVPVLLPAR